MKPGMPLRPMSDADLGVLWDIFQDIIHDGTTYVEDETTTIDDFRQYWLGRGGVQFVAEQDGEVLGGYTLRANQRGRGDHVATASYIVRSNLRGRGLGRTMGQHSLEQARDLGFRAVQFNFVVATNGGAVKLWQDLGFQTVGTLPGVFRHPLLGDVDAYVMHRVLD